MRKRTALALASSTLAALAALSRADDAPVRLKAGPLVGYAGHDAAAIWALPEKPDAALEVAFAPEGRTEERRERLPPLATPETCGTTLRLSGLEPATVYRYRVLVDGKDSEETRGWFRTAPAPGKPVKGRIGVVSCMNVGSYPTRQVAWTALQEEKPDLLLYLGDNVYANSTDPARLRALHVAQRRVPEQARILRAVSTLAIWDDHDFATNDSDGTAPGKERSLATFREVWPNPSYGLPDTPGVFFQVRFGDVDLFMLDGRYHRSPNFAKDGPEKKFLGDEQFAWLERGLLASRARFKLVACGSTVDLGTKDCWNLYKADRDRLLAFTNKVSGIVLLTGDIHSSMVMRPKPGPSGAGYTIHEVISSGLAVNAKLHYFTVLHVDTTAADPTLTVRIHRVLEDDGKASVSIEKTIRASELEPAT